MLFPINVVEFSKKLKKIRTNYCLSTYELADLLGLKSSSSITNMEKCNASPSIDFINNMCMMFALSSDWLLGYTDTPYTSQCVLNAERIALNTLNSIKTIPTSQQTLDFFKLYYDESLRPDNYSLAVRANLVFFIYFLDIPYTKMFNEYIRLENSKNPLDQLKLEYKDFKSLYFKDSATEKKIAHRSAHYTLLLNRYKTDPVYDITKDIEQK